MGTDHKSSDFKKLLDKLQTESWQLELLISGFAIFGLFQALDPVKRELTTSIANNQEVYGYLVKTLYPTISILLIVLLIHVILRGVWIGALGLRYVSGDIDYDTLKYSKKFNDHLTKKVGSFDEYISKLENICSTLFAIAFLMIFQFMAYMLVIGFFIMLVNLIEFTGVFNKDQQLQFEIAFGLIYFSLALLILVDFIGMGVLKKGNLRPKIYFPIYRFFSIITLSFLYRPLVYNFLDQKKGKWLATFILPTYFIGSILVSSFTRKPSNYLLENSDSSIVHANSRNYEDVLNANEDLIDFATIPSKVITKNHLHLKIPFTDFKEEAVFEQDTSLILEKDERGYGFHGSSQANNLGISLNFNTKTSVKEQQKYLDAVNQMYQILIDTLEMDKEFVYTINEYERLQFETFLDLSQLANGKHLLKIIGPQREGSSVLNNVEIIRDTLVTIPFWYFKE
jgi:hypothetical protein